MVSWESPSHSSTNTAQNSSLSSEWNPQRDMIRKSLASHCSNMETQDQPLTEKQPTRESLLREKCNGIMGVPISFMDKYCPEQFEIVSLSMAGCNENSINLKRDYKTFLGYTVTGKLTGRTGSIFGACPTLVQNDHKTVYYTDGEKTVQATYCRVFVKFTYKYTAEHSEQSAKEN